ncbi:MAG: hypothetical protein KY476_05835 [Planctomycetes bacterium]|nr:hypothetical protein [Planctomycetota bacterium]
MPTPAEVPEIVAEVRRRLAEIGNQGVYLQVTGDKLEDDWLYVVVSPSRPGVRALDHANLMSQIERELRQQGKEQVLLVPTLEE